MNIPKKIRRACRAILACLTLTPPAASMADPAQLERSARAPLAGVNVAGAEFGALPGVHGADYIYPSAKDLQAIADLGFSLIRLPFRWERLQPDPMKDFDAAEAQRLQAAVDEALKLGMSVILDVHNYGRRYDRLIGSAEVSHAAFADLWRRLGEKYKNRPGVLFGLMNEPHDQSAKTWVVSVQAALDALHGVGARNVTLVPGANWTGAHSWRSVGPNQEVSNAQAMARLRDRDKNLVFEFHQYLDDDFSGTHKACLNPERIAAALNEATIWLREKGKIGFLGEFGASAEPNCLRGLDAMLAHMAKNSDVWMGWAYWASGPWWPKDYPLSIHPMEGVDRPQMKILSKWIPNKKPPLVASRPGG